MPKSISVVCIGAGNVSSHITPALANIGCIIKQVYSRKINNARILAGRVESIAIDNLKDIDKNSDLYLVMVPDDHISDVGMQLPELNENQYLAHCSGAQEISKLKKFATNFGSFYPLQSFRKDQELDMGQTPFLINGSNPETTRFLRTIARKVSSKVYNCTDKERLHYHLAAVYLNNFTNHLACISREILSSKGLDPKVLDPITQTTFEKIIESDPCSSQTGPAIRQDEKLQKKHLKELKDDDDWRKIYKAISRSIKNKYHEDS